MRVKIVKFDDGSYGIRKWTFFGYRYYDLVSNSVFWWSKENYHKDCRSNDLEDVKKKFSYLFDKGTPI